MSMAFDQKKQSQERFRDAAVDLARRGFHVFRLVEGAKIPKDKKPYEIASADPENVYRVWSDEHGQPERWNIGVLAGTPYGSHGILHIIDVDVKPGKVGRQSLRERPWLTRDTFTVITATGGLHLYYLVDGETTYSNGASKIGPDIDNRGYHGYVVGPGSEVNGRPYGIIEDAPVAPAPPELIPLLARKKDGPSLDPTKALVLIDSDAAVQHAIEYLQSEEYPASGRRNPVSHIVACRLKDRGISLDTALNLATQYWQFAYDDTDFRDELIKTFTSAYNTGLHPPGISSPAHQFEDLSGVVDDEMLSLSAPKPKSRKIEILSFDELILAWKNFPPPLIKDLLLTGTFSVIYGPPGQGKSFVTIDMLMHIALGKPWCDLETRQGPTCYIYGEGGHAVGMRAEAAARRHGWDNGSSFPPFFAIGSSINLFSGTADTDALIAAIKAQEALIGPPFAAIAIDTLARSMAGGNENDAKDLAIVVENIDRIRLETSAHVLLVHHTGKDLDRGARGSNALLGAVDTEILINDNTLRVTKQRDIETKFESTYALMSYELGSRDGIQIKSGAIYYRNPTTVVDDIPTGDSGPVMPKGWPSYSVCLAILATIQSDAKAGNPWSSASQNKAHPRYAKTQISARFGITPHVAGEMVKTWLAQGVIETAMVDTHTRQKGLVVVKSLDISLAEVEKNRAEVEK